MDKYKTYIARTESDRVQLDILCALEKLVEHFETPMQIEAKAPTHVESAPVKQATKEIKKPNKKVVK